MSIKKKQFYLFAPLIIILIFLLRGKIPHEKFDSHLWITANLNSEENWSLRWDMMNDLRSKYNLVGMTKKEVVNLLGTPNDSSTSSVIYFLGYSKTGINTGNLSIAFFSP